MFERDIAKEIDREAKAAEAMMIKAKETNAAYGTGIKKSLDEELKEGETKITRKMKEEKAEFIKKFQKHQIKSRDEDFEKALLGKQQVNVISVQKHKRDNEEDL